MQKERIHSDAAPAALGPYSQGNALAHLIFTSGQLPLNSAGELQKGIEAQSHQVMKNLTAVLQAGDSSLDAVVKTTCYLSDIKFFDAFNAVYSQYLTEPFPARSCFAVKDLPKGALLEIEAIAYR